VTECPRGARRSEETGCATAAHMEKSRGIASAFGGDSTSLLKTEQAQLQDAFGESRARGKGSGAAPRNGGSAAKDTLHYRRRPQNRDIDACRHPTLVRPPLRLRRVQE